MSWPARARLSSQDGTTKTRREFIFWWLRAVVLSWWPYREDEYAPLVHSPDARVASRWPGERRSPSVISCPHQLDFVPRRAGTSGGPRDHRGEQLTKHKRGVRKTLWNQVAPACSPRCGRCRSLAPDKPVTKIFGPCARRWVYNEVDLGWPKWKSQLGER